MKNSNERLGDLGWSLYRNEVGIHTFELQYEFNFKIEYAMLQRIWNELICKNPRCSNNKHTVSIMRGLRIQILNIDAGQILKIIVNPSLMVDGEGGYLGITDRHSNILARCKRSFDAYWKKNGFESIRMNRCSLTRVDLCMAIAFSGNFTVANYIDLLKHTPHNARMSLYAMPDSEQDQHVFDIFNQSRGLMVYDKRYEQQRYGNSLFDCEHLMRIEYRLRARAIGKLRGQKNLIGNLNLLGWILDHSPELLCEGVHSCLFGEPYFSAEKIRAQIKSRKEWRPETKDRMWRMQQELYHAKTFDSYIAPFHTIEEWKEFPMAEIDVYQQRRKQMGNLLQRYKELGISPVALPKRCGILCLPSLPQLVCAMLYNRMCNACQTCKLEYTPTFPMHSFNSCQTRL